MALIVQKYGGTSVGSVERIKNVAKRVAKWRAAGHDVVVVVSAMSGETNRLIVWRRKSTDPRARELDQVARPASRSPSASPRWRCRHRPKQSYTGGRCHPHGRRHTKARISPREERIRKDLDEGT